MVVVDGQTLFPKNFPFSGATACSHENEKRGKREEEKSGEGSIF
jgi:hypothetical protein